MQAVLARMIASLKPGGFLVMALAHRDEAALPSFCDYSLLTTYYCTTRCSLLTTLGGAPVFLRLLTTYYLLLTTHYSLLTTYYPRRRSRLSTTTYYLLLTTYSSLLTAHYSLP